MKLFLSCCPNSVNFRIYTWSISTNSKKIFVEIGILVPTISMWLQNLTSRDIYMTETMLTFYEFWLRNPEFILGGGKWLLTDCSAIDAWNWLAWNKTLRRTESLRNDQVSGHDLSAVTPRVWALSPRQSTPIVSHNKGLELMVCSPWWNPDTALYWIIKFVLWNFNDRNREATGGFGTICFGSVWSFFYFPFEIYKSLWLVSSMKLVSIRTA